ncbi:MAG: hypothetical protein U9R04_02160 [Chloroflexota bacterium]|nr:hypothetical protein [Chloroflexota bacterium]
MRKGIKILIGGLAVVGILAGSLTGVAMAASPDNTANSQTCRASGQAQGQAALCVEAVSELLGLTPEEIRDLRQEGNSLAEIAAAQGVSKDALVETIMTAEREAIQQKVADGWLTQKQADLILEKLENRIYGAVDREATGLRQGARIRLMKYLANQVRQFHRHQVRICAEPVSDLLGLTPEEIRDLRQEGNSLAEIAAAQGVSKDALVETIMTAEREAIQQKVADGWLTQKQADLILKKLENRIYGVVDREATGLRRASPETRPSNAHHQGSNFH